MSDENNNRKRPDLEINKRIPLVCPCGRPLELLVITKQPDSRIEYVIGHLEKTCSPLVHGGILAEVLDLFAKSTLHFGHFPTVDDHAQGLFQEYVRADQPEIVNNLGGDVEVDIEQLRKIHRELSGEQDGQ